MHNFCWIDLCTNDVEGASAFYGQLFGWKAEGPKGYTMLSYEGKEVGAMFEMAGLPPHWKAYVAVESVDATVEKAKGLGASVVMPPHDVSDSGRTAVLTDPSGAVFALWQPRQHSGFGLRDAPHSFCWEELITTDVPASKAFYTELFGWDTQTDQVGPISYTQWKQNGTCIGGMLARPEGMEAPPHWATYFAVGDVDASTEKAVAAGGTVCKPPADIPGVGRFAVIFDPQGAVFYLFKTV